MSNLVPDGWSLDKIGAKISLIPGFAFNSLEFLAKGVPLIRMGNLYNNKLDLSRSPKFLPPTFLEKHSRFVIRENDIVFSMTGTAGKEDYGFAVKIPVNSPVCLLNQRVAKIEAKKGASQSFVLHLLHSRPFLDEIYMAGSGTKQANLSSNDILSVNLLFPPLHEQQKIAIILTSVDEVIEKTQAQIDKLKDLKTGMMQELLTNGIGHTEFKDSPVGRIPAEWDVGTIDQYAHVSTGSKNTQDKVSNGKYPFIVRSQKVAFINSYSFDEEAILTAGDGVGTGKVFHYLNEKFDVHQRVYVIRKFEPKMLGKFLYFYFSSNFIFQVNKFSAKGSVDSVRMDMIAKMNIPVPSIEEQKVIADSIASVEKSLCTKTHLLNAYKKQKKALMQDLLTGKVRVKI